MASPLTRLLSHPSHHTAFRGATGLAKNAKSLWNGQKIIYCSKKKWTDGHWLSNDGLYSTDTKQHLHFPTSEKAQGMGHMVTKEIQNLNFLFKEENSYRKSCCKDTLLLADAYHPPNKLCPFPGQYCLTTSFIKSENHYFQKRLSL